MRHVLVPLMLGLIGLSAQDLPPEVLLLARIRAQVAETIGRLPDCTCLETMAREVKPPGKPPRSLDTVVLQILFSGGNELFASPGETRWEHHPGAFVSSGMISDGLFALNLRSVFLNNQSVIRFHGWETFAGRPAARYDFSIPLIRSGYSITNGGAYGVVATAGSFWADPQTYDLYRLEFHAVDIPPELQYADAFTAIQYTRVRLGERDILLPEQAEVKTVGLDGSESRDVVQFTDCRGFRTESSVVFGDVDGPAARGDRPTAAPPPDVEEAVAPEFRITAALTTPIDDRSTVGTLVEARVAGNLAVKGKVLIPEGARVRGRIRRMEHYPEAGGYFIVALEFTRLEMAGRNLRFYADLLELEHREGVEMVFSKTGGTDLQFRTLDRNQGLASSITVIARVWTRDVPGVGTFFVHGSHFLLPAGFRTVWKTRLLPQSAAP